MIELLFAVTIAIGQATPGIQIPAQFQTKSPTSAQPVLRVNGETFAAKDLEPFLWDWMSYQAAQEVAYYELVMQEVRRVGATVSESEVQKEYDRQLAELKANVPTGKTLADVFREQNFSPSRHYLRVKMTVALDKIVEKEFDKSKFVKVSTIAIHITNEQTPSLIQAVKRADDAYGALGKGSPWDKVVESYVTDEKAAKNHGFLGWRLLSAFPTSVKNEIDHLGPGQYTHPAQVNQAIQIFRIEALGKSAEGKELDDLKKTFTASQRAETVSRLRGAAKIEYLWPTK